MVVSSDILSRREALGMTRDQLQASSGISRETIRKIEVEDYRPSPATMRKLERCLADAERAGDVFTRLGRLEVQVAELLELVRRLTDARR